MASVLAESFNLVVASDIHPYGYGSVGDFLEQQLTVLRPDLIWTNRRSTQPSASHVMPWRSPRRA